MKTGVVLLILLSACSDSCFWRYQNIQSECPCFSSQLIHYLPKNSCNTIDLQFLKSDEYGILCYLGVYNCAIPPAEINPKTSEVIIGIDGMGTKYYALRMEADQRLLLPEMATEQLLEAFCAEKTVIVSLDGFYAEISGCDFPRFKQ